jgi:hypothetical protein
MYFSTRISVISSGTPFPSPAFSVLSASSSIRLSGIPYSP